MKERGYPVDVNWARLIKKSKNTKIGCGDGKSRNTSIDNLNASFNHNHNHINHNPHLNQSYTKNNMISSKQHLNNQ